MTVCLLANAVWYPQGGHLWVYLNWALGFLAIGCDVFWLETSRHEVPPRNIAALKTALDQVGLGNKLIIVTEQASGIGGAANIEQASGADLLVSLHYRAPDMVVSR